MKSVDIYDDHLLVAGLQNIKNENRGRHASVGVSKCLCVCMCVCVRVCYEYVSRGRGPASILSLLDRFQFVGPPCLWNKILSAFSAVWSVGLHWGHNVLYASTLSYTSHGLKSLVVFV